MPPGLDTAGYRGASSRGGSNCDLLPRSSIETCSNNALFENGRDFDEWCSSGHCHVIPDEIKACFAPAP